jgi:import inner membrane translocase subunit TIM50
LAGTGYLAYDLGKEWENEDERKKFIARSDDHEAIEMAQKDGWEGFIGRIRLRGADQLDVSSFLSLLVYCHNTD